MPPKKDTWPRILFDAFRALIALSIAMMWLPGCTSNRSELDKLCQTAESILTDGYPEHGQAAKLFRERYLARSPSKQMQKIVFEEMASLYGPGGQYEFLQLTAREKLDVADWSCPALQAILIGGGRPADGCPAIPVSLPLASDCPLPENPPTECITNDPVINITSKSLFLNPTGRDRSMGLIELESGRVKASDLRQLDQVQVIALTYQLLEERAKTAAMMRSKSRHLPQKSC